LPDAPGADWSELQIDVDGSDILRYALTRALRARHGVVDVRVAAPPRVGDSALAISVRELARDGSSTWEMVGLLSCSLIPAYWQDRADLELTIRAPDGARWTGSDRIVWTSVGWLPFLFVAPNLFISVNGPSKVEIDPAWLDVREQAIAAVLTRAATFVAEHRGGPRR
jgi:hypothetical protein